jgi:UDP-glucose 4-epimerase
MPSNKILITGGAGFIGYHLTRHILSQAENVSIVLADNFQRGRKDADFENLLKDKRIKLVELDLTDESEYKKLGKGYDHVYHLAAVNGTKAFYDSPHEVLRINTLSLIHMLEWFRKENPDGKFCFTSSNEAYAGALIAFNALPIPTPEKVPLVIEDPYNPRWSYASTKLIGELFVIHYAAKYNFKAVIVRPHNFYGPRAGYGGHVIPDFCERINQKVDPFPIFGADDTRTFCYITDAVRAMAMLMESEKTNMHPIETFHIGDTEEITIKDLAEKMFKVTDWHPKKLDIKNGPVGSVKRRLADISKIEKFVGWKPEISLEKGLKMTYDWYTNHPNKA